MCPAAHGTTNNPSVGVGLLDDPPGLYHTPLVRCHCEGAPRPWQSVSPHPKISRKIFDFPLDKGPKCDYNAFNFKRQTCEEEE